MEHDIGQQKAEVPAFYHNPSPPHQINVGDLAASVRFWHKIMLQEQLLLEHE